MLGSASSTIHAQSLTIRKTTRADRAAGALLAALARPVCAGLGARCAPHRGLRSGRMRLAPRSTNPTASTCWRSPATGSACFHEELDECTWHVEAQYGDGSEPGELRLQRDRRNRSRAHQSAHRASTLVDIYATEGLHDGTLGSVPRPPHPGDGDLPGTAAAERTRRTGARRTGEGPGRGVRRRGAHRSGSATATSSSRRRRPTGSGANAATRSAPTASPAPRPGGDRRREVDPDPRPPVGAPRAGRGLQGGRLQLPAARGRRRLDQLPARPAAGARSLSPAAGRRAGGGSAGGGPRAAVAGGAGGGAGSAGCGSSGGGVASRLRRGQLPSRDRVGLGLPDLVQRDLDVGPERRREEEVEDERDPAVERLLAGDARGALHPLGPAPVGDQRRDDDQAAGKQRQDRVGRVLAEVVSPSPGRSRASRG